jgi:cytochrome c556
MGRMDKVLDVFPKGSSGGKFRAKEKIWEKWDDFTKLPPKGKDVAGALATAAAAKDESRIRAQLKNIYADSPFRSGVRNECHRTSVRVRHPLKKPVVKN